MKKRINESIWLIDRTLTDTSTPIYSGPDSYVIEGTLQMLQISRTRISLSDAV